jgi:agmatinase
MKFLDIPDEYNTDGAKFAVLPIPFEGTVSYGKGTAGGPNAIIKASHNLEYYDDETDSEPFEEGIQTFSPLVLSGSHEEHQVQIHEAVKEILQRNENRVLISLGGEHSISFGIVKAFKERYEHLSVLHLDAHLDLRDNFEGTHFSHACVMKRISELHVPLVQCGIRSMDIEEKHRSEQINTKVFKMPDILYDKYWMDKAIDSLTQDVYITIDVDCFDPSIMPATGTPEPGGIDYYQIISFLKLVIEKKNVVAIDIVELAPIDGMHSCDYTIAKIVYKIIAYLSLKKNRIYKT